MPSSISHAVAGFAVGAALAPRAYWRPLVITGVACAVIPDVDALPRLLGAPEFAALGGHRGFTHSIAFAILTGLVVSTCVRTAHARVFACIGVATLSHGVLDTFTDFGSRDGVGLLMPVVDARYLAPWQPVRGEFSELFFCFLPLVASAWVTLRLRGIRVAMPVRRRPVELRLNAGRELQADVAASGGEGGTK